MRNDTITPAAIAFATRHNISRVTQLGPFAKLGAIRLAAVQAARRDAAAARLVSLIESAIRAQEVA